MVWVGGQPRRSVATSALPRLIIIIALVVVLVVVAAVVAATADLQAELAEPPPRLALQRDAKALQKGLGHLRRVVRRVREVVRQSWYPLPRVSREREGKGTRDAPAACLNALEHPGIGHASDRPEASTSALNFFVGRSSPASRETKKWPADAEVKCQRRPAADCSPKMVSTQEKA